MNKRRIAKGEDCRTCLNSRLEYNERYDGHVYRHCKLNKRNSDTCGMYRDTIIRVESIT
jgi:hypothetical protein